MKYHIQPFLANIVALNIFTPLSLKAFNSS